MFHILMIQLLIAFLSADAESLQMFRHATKQKI